MIGLGKNERRALIALGLIVAFVGISIYKVGTKNLWFVAKNKYLTSSPDAADLNEGSSVTISGMRVGEITHMQVNEDNIIDIEFTVAKSFSHRLRKDAKVMFARASIFGEKHIDLLPGSSDQPQLTAGAFVEGRDTTGLSDFITGRKLAELMTDIEDIITSTKKIAAIMENLADNEALSTHAESVELIQPALKNFVTLSDDLLELTEQVKKRKTDLPGIVEHGNKLVTNLNKDLLESGLTQSALSSVDRVMGPIADRQLLVEQLLGNLENLSATLTKNPDYGEKILDTLTEMTVTLKALQKTWILSGHTDEVKMKDSQPTH